MKNQKYKNILAVGIIVIFTIMMISPFLLIHQLGVHSDWSFHAARVQQIYLNLQKGHLFTYIATDTFSKVGNANFIFYPTVFLYPWVFLKFIFAPVTAYLIYVWLLFLATGLIAFYSMRTFTNGKIRQSLFFAIIYLIIPYHLYLTLSNYVLGEAQAYIFIPLVLLGMWEILYKDKWVTLAISMTLMVYSHYVSAFISLEICVLILICYLIQNHKLELSKAMGFIKSICLFMILSAWQLIPLFTDYFHGNLMRPASGFMLMQSAGDFFTSAISNEALNQGGIGVVLLATLVFGWLFVERESKYMWIYVLGVAITWMITTAFPWQYVAKTPLSIVQFPYRYTSYAAAFLAIVLAKALSKLKYSTMNSSIVTTIIILFLGALYSGSVYSDITRNRNTDNSISILTSRRHGQYKTLRDPSDSPIIVTNNSYNKQFSYGALYGETDYMPVDAFKHCRTVLNRVTFINGKRALIHQESQPNRIVYKIHVKQFSSINLPALVYKHTVVKVNGNKVKEETSDRGTVQLKLSKGNYKVDVSYVPTCLLSFLMAISLISWILVIIINYTRFVKLS